MPTTTAITDFFLLFLSEAYNFHDISNFHATLTLNFPFMEISERKEKHLLEYS
jgi:hypothetical protein